MVSFVNTAPAGATAFANAHHSPTLDFFFKWYTKIAEWPVVVLAIGLALMQHVKTGIWMGLCYGTEAIVVNLLKTTLHAPRPRIELGIENMHTIAGVEIHSYYSMPSGHTAAAFIGFGIIALVSNKRWIHVVCAFAAALVAYSRLYLGQHYLRDVMAGEIIALLILLVFWRLHDRFFHLKFERRNAK